MATTKATRATSKPPTDTYFELVQEFPLVHIQDDAHLAAASAMLDRLLRMELDRGGQDYLDVLTDMVERYEDENVEIPDASEAEVLRSLMSANGLTQARLAQEVGIPQSTISAVLNSTRELTKHQVLTLARRFNVSPAAFMPSA